MKTVLILSGGVLDEHFVLQQLSGPYDKLIAAEHGADFALDHGIVPDLVVGDFDSTGEKTVERVKAAGIPIERHPARKNETDTELAVSCALREDPDKLIILGGTGTRLDHVLANIAILGELAGSGPDLIAEVRDAHNRIRMVTDRCVFSKQEVQGKYLSLMPYTDSVEGVTVRGVSYPVDHRSIRKTQTAGLYTSNEPDPEAEQVVITVRHGILCVILSND